MKKTIWQIITFSFVIIFFSFTSIVVFTSSAFTKYHDMLDKGAIGDTLGGVTAPLIGIVSSVLLYLALIKQVESNKEQRLKNESDIIFSLINQLDSEVSSFYTKTSQGKEERKLTGLEGINDFCSQYRYRNDITQFKDMPGYTFKAFYEAGQIVVIIDTLNLIEARITISNLSLEMKDLFRTKMNSYYDAKLSIPLITLSEAFERYPHQRDYLTKRIQDFVNKRGNKEELHPHLLHKNTE